MSKLTPKQRRFALEYCVDLNAKQAAIRAGYAPRSAKVTGCRLLTKVNVQAAIAKQGRRVAERIELTQEVVLQGLLKIATVDPTEFFDGDGDLLPPHAIPKAIRPALASLEVNRTELGDGVIQYTKKVRLRDAIRAYDLLGKHLKLWVERRQFETPDGAPLKPEIHVHLNSAPDDH